jgi:hypothetical protein
VGALEGAQADDVAAARRLDGRLADRLAVLRADQVGDRGRALVGEVGGTQQDAQPLVGGRAPPHRRALDGGRDRGVGIGRPGTGHGADDAAVPGRRDLVDGAGRRGPALAPDDHRRAHGAAFLRSGKPLSCNLVA